MTSTATALRLVRDGDYSRLVGQINGDTAILAVHYSDWPSFVTRCKALVGSEPQRRERLRGTIPAYEVYDRKES
ncbi:MAG TPA: hypothetical protein VFX53_09390 [Pedococcus sp.]|nr:hypothetical protein [Pedococcus sp.]